MKHLNHYYGSMIIRENILCVCVCVCARAHARVCVTNTTKTIKVLNDKVSYACWLRIFNCSFLSVIRRNCCFRGWKKSHRQGILKKGMFAWPIHFVAFDGCWWIWESYSILSGSHTGESVLALQVKMKKRKSVWRRSIYTKYVSWSRLQKRGTKFKWGRSFKYWPRGSPCQWFPETDCLCGSAIFISGTSGIPPILNYRSVSPIDSSVWLKLSAHQTANIGVSVGCDCSQIPFS